MTNDFASNDSEKKKMELGVVHEQEMELEKQNRKLQQEHDSLVQELHFMKKLMRDVFRKTSSSRWKRSDRTVLPISLHFINDTIGIFRDYSTT